jgi:hypothetical protein
VCYKDLGRLEQSQPDKIFGNNNLTLLVRFIINITIMLLLSFLEFKSKLLLQRQDCMEISDDEYMVTFAKHYIITETKNKFGQVKRGFSATLILKYCSRHKISIYLVASKADS